MMSMVFLTVALVLAIVVPNLILRRFQFKSLAAKRALRSLLFLLVFAGVMFTAIRATLGPLDYEAGSRRFYKNHKQELWKFVDLYSELNRTYGFTFHKSSGGIMMYPASDTVREFSGMKDPDLIAFLKRHHLDEKKFGEMLTMFRKLRLKDVERYEDGSVHIAIKDLFPMHKAKILFDRGNSIYFKDESKKIDEGVYYYKFNDCC